MTLLLLASLLACNSSEDDATTDDSGTPTVVDCSQFGLEFPTARGESSGVWDETHRRMVIFGGDHGTPVECRSQTVFVDETWAFYPDCGAFEQLSPDVAPPSRGRAAHALDAGRGRMLLHGGRTREGTSGLYTLHRDLWAFDLQTNQWSVLTEEDGPSRRTNHTLTVVGDTAYLYGGNKSRDGGFFEPLDDVWAFDLEAGTWSELTTTGEDPGPRLFHAAATDGTKLYVYGGGDEGAFLGPFFGDLYALDLQTLEWSRLAGKRGGPAARIWPSLHYDASANRLVLWAGHDDGSLGNTNEVWSFDLATNTWNQEQVGDIQTGDALGFCNFPADFAEPDLDAPERRNGHVAALRPNGEILTFGGKTDCGLINDVWGYDLATQSWSEYSPASEGEICLRAFQECETMCF